MTARTLSELLKGINLLHLSISIIYSFHFCICHAAVYICARNTMLFYGGFSFFLFYFFFGTDINRSVI